jgi:predicted N-acetyltransferase YhbS
MSDVRIRVMRETDVVDADRIFRLAFGTFLGLPDPLAFAGDSDYIRGRWRAEPSAAFVAELDGAVVGSNLATRWGSVGFFGPLSVRPDLWNRGVARKLLEPVMDCFTAWGTTHAGLFTFAQSAKHVALYGKYGFYPRFLTAVMTKPIASTRAGGWTTYSSLGDAERRAVVTKCRALTSAVYDGLDLTHEIRVTAEHRLGDTVLLVQGDALVGFAVCHVGAGTEAGSGTCFAKFGAVQVGAGIGEFDDLLVACESFGATRGATSLVAGTNLAREHAYRHMLATAFRTTLQGIAMHRPNEPGYGRPDVLALDDWR